MSQLKRSGGGFLSRCFELAQKLAGSLRADLRGQRCDIDGYAVSHRTRRELDAQRHRAACTL
jgi:hypothetical protein